MGAGFEPNMSMNRAMLATVVYRMAGQPATTAQMLDDVPANAWYSRAANWAVANGIMEDEWRDFSPMDPVSRQELALTLYRKAADLLE